MSPQGPLDQSSQSVSTPRTTTTTSVTTGDSSSPTDLQSTAGGSSSTGSATSPADPNAAAASSSTNTGSFSTTSVPNDGANGSGTSSIPTSPTSSFGTSTASITSNGNATGITASASPLPIHNNGLSTGAKAGIAVGVVLGVALIGGFAFLLWRRRQSGRRQPRGGLGRSLSGPKSKTPYAPVAGGAVPASAREKALPVAVVAPYRDDQRAVPQQADDATVQSRFSTLYDQIELHVENFYQDASPMIPPETEAALSRYDSPLLGSPLAACLEESPRSRTILKHVLSYEITTTAIDPTSGGNHRCLLPAPLLAAIGEAEAEQNKEYDTSSAPAGHPAYDRLKDLAAQYRSSPPTSTAGRDSATHFSQVFSLWADPQFDESLRVNHLAQVMESAVKLAVWLFSHPERFEVRWTDTESDDTTSSSSSDHHSLVTAPALVKVSGQGGGRRLTRGEEKVMTPSVRKRI